MKKLFFTTVTLFVFSLIFTGCTKYKKDDFLCTCGKIEIDKKEYIAMCVMPDIVTSTSTNYLRIENHTKREMGYGTYFVMEYFDDNCWVRTQFDMMYDLMLLTLFPGECDVMETPYKNFNLYALIEKYNDAKKGKYRIIKDNINVGGSSPRYLLIAEFEVQ